MFTRMFGKPKQETNALASLDKLNEVGSPIAFTSSSYFLFSGYLLLLLTGYFLGIR